MAMLMLDDIFVRTWGERATGGPSPDGGRGYWPTVIEAVRATHPDFVFWAEAYWDLEPVLVEQGFDACYDKRLYDRLVDREPASSVRAHLGADPAYQAHTVRFVENHDEPRLAATLPPAPARAAAVVALTLPGRGAAARGAGRRSPGAGPGDAGPPPRRAARRRPAGLVRPAARRHRRRDAAGPTGRWPPSRAGPTTARSSGWWRGRGRAPTHRHLVVVNLSDERADGMVRWPDVPAGPLTLVDLLDGETFERDGTAIAADGLYVALDGWAATILRT